VQALQYPNALEPKYLYTKLDERISWLRFSTRRGDLALDLELTYNQCISVMNDLNSFLESPDEDYDLMLTAVAALNVHLEDLAFHVRSSVRSRKRLQSHIATRLTDS